MIYLDISTIYSKKFRRDLLLITALFINTIHS